MALASVALRIVQTWLFANVTPAAGMMDGGVMSNVIAAVLTIVVMLRISRWRSKLAWWFAILWHVVTLPVGLAILLPVAFDTTAAVRAFGWAWLGMAQVMLALVACGLLLSRSTRRWINRERTLDDLGETFS